MRKNRLRWLEHILRREEKEEVRVIKEIYVDKKGKKEDQKCCGIKLKIIYRASVCEEYAGVRVFQVEDKVVDQF